MSGSWKERGRVKREFRQFSDPEVLESTRRPKAHVDKPYVLEYLRNRPPNLDLSSEDTFDNYLFRHKHFDTWHRWNRYHSLDDAIKAAQSMGKKHTVQDKLRILLNNEVVWSTPEEAVDAKSG